MSAPITDVDRAAAHEALTEKPITCDDMRPGISHDWICEDVAQAIADAREAENEGCEAVARERCRTAEAALVERRRARRSSNDVDSGLWYKRDEADLIADAIAARRSR